MDMIEREAQETVLRLAKGFPVVCITGPRQSGKTTLAQMCFPQKAYLSLDDPDIAHLARRDPRGVLENYPDGAILDEVQSVPELFSYLKTAVDKRKQMGSFILTGSQQFSLLEKVSESLAGRAAYLSLYPLSVSELGNAGLLPQDANEFMVKGGYPALYDRQLSSRDWYSAYIQSYIERDVRSVINVQNLGQFQTFIRMCASRVGTLLNLSSLAADCGLSHNTVKAWISVLETSGIVFLLRPYFKNFGKRLVKTPKLYFYDTGLLCMLLGITDADELFFHPARGAIFECMIISDLYKSRLNRGEQSDFYFWRDNTGNEVDVVFEKKGILHLVEIKSGKTIQSDFTQGLKKLAAFSQEKKLKTAVIYAGDFETINDGISFLSWKSKKD